VVDVDAVLRENAELRAQLATVTTHFTGVVDKLTTQIATLNDRVAELLAVAKRKQRKATPKPAIEQMAPTLGDDARRSFDDRPKPPGKPEPPAKTPKPRRPTGRKALPSHLEAENHELRPDTCGDCGSHDLDAVDVVVEEKLHVVKEHQRRRVVRRTTCRCKKCGARTTLPSLPAPYARSKVTCDWLAWLVHQKFGLLTPLDRTRRDLAERDVPLAMGSLVSFIEKAADLLAPVDGLHWQQLLAGRWMATDGTGLKVLVPKLPEAHDGYIELYRSNDAAVFQYEPGAYDGHFVVMQNTTASADWMAFLQSYLATGTPVVP